MAEKTGIEWCDSSWSPWWGCTRVSPGCVHCYAESLSKRYGHQIWGPEAPRRFLSENHWRQPLRWNTQAAKDGRIRRVFPSMCDPLEDRPDLDGPRQRFFELVDATPNLMWLILTKRADNWDLFPMHWLHKEWPHHVMFGVTIEDNERLDGRLEAVDAFQRRTPDVKLFASCEPLLGDIAGDWVERFHWIICGGESGHGARPMRPDWARSLRDQCSAAGVPFLFKQWGEFGPPYFKCDDCGKNSDFNEYCFECAGELTEQAGLRVGKKAAGRLLDGREWNELPKYWPANVGLLEPELDPLKVIA